MKKTKIVCTIGPKTEKPEFLSAMIDAGMNVMRLNFSHGDYEEHGARISTLRKVAQEKWKHVAILLDTKWPEIRTGKVLDQDLVLSTGDEVVLTTEDVSSQGKTISISYKNLPEDVEVGGLILLDDGLVGLEILSKNTTEIFCRVKNNGVIGSTRGVNVPRAKLKLPALSARDKDNLVWGCQQGIDFVAASFIRKASDVKEVREILSQNWGEHIKIIAKIENQEGLDNFDEILAIADGIMVARGDLWVEIEVEELPIVQKMMVEKTVQAGKFAITATQMLDSMMKNPRPTRAEVTDVANAVLDGTDAVMLSGETAKHNCAYPVEAVDTMARICVRADKELNLGHLSFAYLSGEAIKEVTQAIAKWAVETAKIVHAKLIVVVSESWYTARQIRRYFPPQDILVLTNLARTASQMALLKSTEAVIVDKLWDLDSLAMTIKNLAKDRGLVVGDKIVVIASSSAQWEWKTDMLKVLTID